MSAGPAPIAYSRGRTVRDNKPAQRQVPTFAAFIDVLDGDRAEDKSKAGYVCTAMNGAGKRCAAAALPRRWLPLDFDRIDADVLPCLEDWLCRFSACIWTTHSSKPEAPRLRAIIELDRPVARDECVIVGDMLARNLAEEFGDAVEIDPSKHRTEQPVFLPPVNVVLARFDGDPLDVDVYLQEAAVLPQPRTLPRPSGDLLEAIEAGDNLHDSVLHLTAKMAGKGMDRETIFAAATGLAEGARARRGARVDELVEGPELKRLVVGADLNLTHPADFNLTRGWVPAL